MVRTADWVLELASQSQELRVCPQLGVDEHAGWWSLECGSKECCMADWPNEASDHPAMAVPYTTFTGLPEADGVVYAVNGVCHQIANRMLYPRGEVVSRAAGYWLSVSTFGTYGTYVGPTAWLVSSDLASAVTASAAIDWQSRIKFCETRLHEDAYLYNRYTEREAAYLRKVRSLYAEADVTSAADMPRADGFALHARELDLMFEYRLGPELDQTMLRALRDLYRLYLTREQPATTGRSSDAFNATAVAAAINEELRAFSAEIARVLGPELFERLYGFPPHREINLVNPRILAKADTDLAA